MQEQKPFSTMGGHLDRSHIIWVS